MTDKITLNNLADLQNQTTAVSTINANNATLVTAIDNTLSRDGTVPNTMLANLDMNSYQILNLPTPGAPQSPLRLKDLTSFNAGTFTVSTLPVGGTANQILQKNTGTDYDAGWTSTPSPTQINYTGATSGTTVVKPVATASGTLTLPSTTDTIICKNTTDTLTNKTIDTAGPNTIKVAGTSLTAVTGSGNVVLATAPTMSSATVNTALTATGVTLAAGTNAVSPLKLTSGTNLTTPTAGSVEYDGTCFYTTPNASNRSVINSDLLLSINANQTGTNVNTAQPWFPGGGATQITLPASTTYFLEGRLSLSRSAGAVAHTIGLLFGGTATITSINYIAIVTDQNSTSFSLSTAQTIESSVATSTVITSSTANAAQSNTIYIRGIIRINGAGTLIPQFIYSAAPGGAPTIQANSWFLLNPVGSSAVLSVGNWS